jgi:hypothetical protein
LFLFILKEVMFGMTARKRPEGEVGFYVEYFTRAEMRDLDRALGESLQGEIGMLRITMRRFFERAAQDADDLEVLADVLRVLGLSCSRLAKIIQTEKALQDKRADELGEALTRSMAAVLEELSSAGLKMNPEGEGHGG